MEAMLTSDITRFKNQLNNKINFMVKAFVEPYFDTNTNILGGLYNKAENSEGILRFNYTATPAITESISDGEDMKRLFPDTVGSGQEVSLTSTENTILSSMKDHGAVPAKGYTIYEYVGTLFVTEPTKTSYTFTLDTTGQAELFIDYVKHVAIYGGGGGLVNSAGVELEMGEYPIRLRFVQVGGAGSTQKLEVKWRKTAADESSADTLKCDNLYYDPTLVSRTSTQSATFNENSLIDNLADYGTKFRSYFGVQNNAFRTAVKSTTNLAKIHVANTGARYNAFVCSGTPTTIPSGDWNSATGKINGDINFHNYLVALASISNVNRLSALIDTLKTIRRMYNALDDVIYEKIKTNPGDATAVIDDYVIATSNGLPNTVNANTVLTSEVMENLSRVTPVERFVLRRLVLLVDLVLHAHISMYIFEMVYGDIQVPCVTAIQGMLGHFVSRLKNLNSKYDQMFESNGSPSQNDILSNLYENIHSFDKNSQKMDKLSTEFKDSKLTLKSNLKTMESEKSLYSSGKNWTRAFLAVTVIVVATLLAYAILSASKPSYKWVGAGAVLMVSSLAVLIIYLVKSKTMEAFNTYNPVAWSQAIATQSSIDVIRVAYQYDMMREVNAYIQNTIHMALILQNSKTYGYINHTIQKEINYYTATKQQVDNAKTLAKSSGRMYNLEKRNNMSRVNVYIALIVILTFAIVGYRLSGDRKFLQYTVLGISAFLLLMVALLYIIDVERKVRTDGRKIYWGQPNDMLAKL